MFQTQKRLKMLFILLSFVSIYGCDSNDDSGEATSGPNLGDGTCLLVENQTESIFGSPQNITALDRYVAQEDPTTKLELISVDKHLLGTDYYYRFTSQTWDAGMVDNAMQEHLLYIHIPRISVNTTGMLLVTGGHNPPKIPNEPDKAYRTLQALLPASSFAVLSQIPNEPVLFQDDPDQQQKYEDAIIAYTWKKVSEGDSVERAARFPMTKAVVLAMEEIVRVTEEHTRNTLAAKTTHFVLAGESKRGWTTWTAAAFDQSPLGKRRIAGIIPIVIAQNIRPAIASQYCAYGTHSSALDEYAQQETIPNLIYDDSYTELFNNVDPYAYRSRFCNIPKLVLNSTGDQFIDLDWSRFYLGDLLGETYFRMYPNVDHSLGGGTVSLILEDIVPFFISVAAKSSKLRPSMAYEFLEDGSIKATTTSIPVEAKLWTANNNNERDFRLETIGKDAFVGTRIKHKKVSGAFEYLVEPQQKENGWTASFIEVSFLDGTTLTTEVQILPKTYSFPQQENFVCPDLSDP